MGETKMNTKISQFTSLASMAVVVFGAVMGLAGHGPLNGDLMNIFYALAALGYLETAVQDYRVYPIDPAVALPSPRKFSHTQRSETRRVSENQHPICREELLGAA